MTSLYVDIARLRIAALEIVEHRLAVHRIIENVCDVSLESITLNCSYGEQPAICGRKATGPGISPCDDKDTPTAFGFFHPSQQRFRHRRRPPRTVCHGRG